MVGERQRELQAWQRALHTVRRSFREFLAIPAAIIACFLALAALTYAADSARIGWLRPVRDVMQRHVFGDPSSTSQLLGTIAGSIITVTSITFSLILLAAQQSAASLTNAVLDQFLRRRVNQVYFGFFIGLAVYALVTLATVAAPFNPIYGATLALLLTIVAVCLLLALIYASVDQMRPEAIITSIHDHTLAARARELDLIRRTRREPSRGGAGVPVHADADGFVVRVDIDMLASALSNASQPAEIALYVQTGTYVAWGDLVADVRAATSDDEPALCQASQQALRLDRSRDLTWDPAFGIEQLESIGWSSISTAKQNPAPGLLVIRNLRDLLARWSAPDEAPDSEPVAVVYHDQLLPQLLNAFVTLGAAAAEATQPQTFSEVLRALGQMCSRVPAAHQPAIGDLARRLLPSLERFVCTPELEAAMLTLAAALEQHGDPATASRLRSALNARLAATA
jgi:uncharacterized membrane protein